LLHAWRSRPLYSRIPSVVSNAGWSVPCRGKERKSCLWMLSNESTWLGYALRESRQGRCESRSCRYIHVASKSYVPDNPLPVDRKQADGIMGRAMKLQGDGRGIDCESAFAYFAGKLNIHRLMSFSEECGDVGARSLTPPLHSLDGQRRTGRTNSCPNPS